MLFHRRQDAQIALDTSRVVIANILLDHLNKLVLADEPSAVIAFPFQDAPEALHRTIVNASANTRHALPHSLFFQHVLELLARVLEAPVTMKQWVCIWVLLDCQLKVSNTSWLLLCLPIAKETISLLFKSRIALR